MTHAIPRLVLAGFLAVASCGCSQTFLQLRCDPAVEFTGAVIAVDGSGDTVAGVDVLVCGIPVGVSTAHVDGAVTICLEPPAMAPVCETVMP